MCEDLEGEDPFPALVELAKKSDRPVFLVPELFVWEKWNQKISPSLFDRIFGSPESPGFLHSLLVFLRNYHRAQFRVGEPIDLKAFADANPSDSVSVLARKVRSSLHHHLARETRAVFGPPAKPIDRLLDEAMRDKVLRLTLEEVAKEKGRPLQSVQREARSNLDEIAARYMPSRLRRASRWMLSKGRPFSFATSSSAVRNTLSRIASSSSRSMGLAGGPNTARVSRARWWCSELLTFRASTATESAGFASANAFRSIGSPTRNWARW